MWHIVTWRMGTGGMRYGVNHLDCLEVNVARKDHNRIHCRLVTRLALHGMWGCQRLKPCWLMMSSGILVYLLSTGNRHKQWAILLTDGRWMWPLRAAWKACRKCLTFCVMHGAGGTTMAMAPRYEWKNPWCKEENFGASASGKKDQIFVSLCTWCISLGPETSVKTVNYIVVSFLRFGYPHLVGRVFFSPSAAFGPHLQLMKRTSKRTGPPALFSQWSHDWFEKTFRAPSPYDWSMHMLGTTIHRNGSKTGSPRDHIQLGVSGVESSKFGRHVVFNHCTALLRDLRRCCCGRRLMGQQQRLSSFCLRGRDHGGAKMDGLMVEKRVDQAKCVWK